NCFSDDGPIIVRVDRFGETHWETNYSVVGIGADIALAFLSQNEWEGTSLRDALYRVYEAKRAAEVNRHVGTVTTFEVLFDDGRRFDISDDAFVILKTTFEEKRQLRTAALPDVFLEPIDADDVRKRVVDKEAPLPHSG